METKETTQLTEEDKAENEAWWDLWWFVVASINDGEVDREEFFKDGKKLFDVKLKQYIAHKCSPDS